VIDMGRAEFNRFGQDIVDARGLEKGIYFNMGSGAVVALDQSTGTNSSLGWLWKLGGVLVQRERPRHQGGERRLRHRLFRHPDQQRREGGGRRRLFGSPWRRRQRPAHRPRPHLARGGRQR
jgi:hypothetical protein